MSQHGPFDSLKVNPETAARCVIGIVTAAWNEHITGLLKQGALETLAANGVSADRIRILDVPGSFELPLGAQKLAQLSEVDAVITLGCVIKGDTPHFDYVCQAATMGILEVGLKYNKPVVFGVITVNNENQALERAGGRHGHKGCEGALTALQMLG